MDREAGGLPSAEVMAGLRSRKDFLKMVGAAGVGAAIGSNIFLPEAFGQKVPVSGSALPPTALKFDIKSQYRPFDVISDNFVEPSVSLANLDSYTVLLPAPESSGGTVSTGNGALSVSSNATFFTLFQTNEAPDAPYAAVIVDVQSFADSATSEDSVYAGLIKDGQNYVMAWYNHATKKSGIDVAVEGTVTKLVERDVDDLTAPVRFAFVLNSKEVTALADNGDGPFDGWKPVANYPNPPEVGGDPAITPGLSQYVDLRDPTVLDQYTYGFGVRGDSGTIVVDGVEAGYWGRAGVRDPHVVTWADGTPYIRDGKLYLTLTNAGLDFFATAHWGVYTLKLSDYTSPTALEEVGKLFFERDGKIMGDHAGHIVYDDATGEFIIGVSTWGDFTYNGVKIYYERTTDDVLHGVWVRKAQELALPTALQTPPKGRWDPHFVRISQDPDEWYVAFVESPTQGNPWDHHPALAKGPDPENLTLVGVESDLQQTEGMVIQKFGGKWYVLCSSGRDEIVDEDAGPATYRIYKPVSDGSGGLVFFGRLKAPYVSNIPHPMVTPIPVNRNTKWVMFTFEGTMYYEPILGYGTHGNFIVMDGQPIQEGYEFPPRNP